MSYITDQMKKQLIALENARYHIEQLARKELQDSLDKPENPNTDINVARLTQIGNIGLMCESIQKWSETVRVCLSIMEDTEEEAEDV